MLDSIIVAKNLEAVFVIPKSSRKFAFPFNANFFFNPAYTKGACVVRNAILCVGTNLGTIWMFKCDDSNTEFNVIDRFYAHDEAILCIDGYGSFLVSTSDKMTYVWNVQNEVKIAYCIMVPG